MKITFTDKTSIDNRPDLSDVEKITGGNINEIKNVVNANADELESTKVKTENLSTEVEALKQKDTAQDTNIQSNTSKIEAINKSIEAINKKNTEQDTNLQKNAKDIEVNQNNIKALQVENAEVKAENERLRSDIESISLPREAEGESIDLNDSSNARFNKFEIYGNHKQETREGYNLLDFNVTQDGRVTVNEDGTIIINGTGGFTLAFKQFTAKANTKYYIKWELVSGTVDTSKSNGNSFLNPLDNTNIKQSEFKENVVENDKNINGFWVNNMTVFTNAVIKFWANTNKSDFEQYGASPSPDYPSEIKTVKDSVEVKVVNKNLYDAEKYPFVKRIAYNSKGVLSYWNGYCGIEKFFPVSENSQYVFSNSLNMPFYCIVYYDNNKNQIKVETEKKAIFTTPEKCRYVRFTIQKEEIPIWVQIKRGSTATDFVEHQEQAITMPVQQEMLKGDYFDWVNEKEIHTWRKEICNGTEKWIQQQTTSAGYWYNHDVGGKGITSGSSQDILCNKLKGINPNEAWNGTKDGINVSNNINVYLKEYSQNKTLDDFKQMLSENPLEIYYKVKTQIKLPFTDKQKAVAKKIKETLHTYKNITHIYSTDETSPIMNVEYAKDLNTVINNMQAQIINNASEEVNG